MSSDEFWKLTWWDWNLWVYRIIELQRKRQQEADLQIELTRNNMALFARAHFKGQWNGTDFYKLSYDKTDTVADDKPAIEQTIKRLEKIAKRKLDGRKSSRKSGNTNSR